MKQVVNKWLGRYFGSDEAVLLAVMIAAFAVLVATVGTFLGPVFTALVIAFLLQGVVNKLSHLGLSHRLSIVIAYVIFLFALISTVMVLVPIVGRQLSLLLAEFPSILAKLQALMISLPEQYSDYITAEQFQILWVRASEEVAKLAEQILTFSLNSFPSLFGVGIYLLLVPVLVFFMLIDRENLVNFVAELLPRKRPVMSKIWVEMDNQFANYIRGKAIEIIIIGVISYLAFLFLGLNYAALLALSVGLSVLIPYIGATVVTFPVLLIAYIQWGYSSEFFWLFILYGAIQIFDGNILVPLLFSEVVNLHPISIIIAVLLFGGIWGFWGVFFAIPLATLVKAIFNAWPVTSTNS
ncbi:MAG: AI-2E family transporter [Porticoccaceae bacterium]|nr:AI-2E family transporter [Porticoccaceae bacterium]